MSIRMANGKVFSVKKPPTDGPTPAQIAERAYDLAIAAAQAAHSSEDYSDDARFNGAASIVDALKERRSDVLAELRDSVINHGPIPWWRKK